VTGSADGTVRVWTAARPEQVATWQQEQLNASNRLNAALPSRVLTEEAKSLVPGLITQWLVLVTMRKRKASTPRRFSIWSRFPMKHTFAHARGNASPFPEKDLIWEPLDQAGPRLELNMLAGQVPTSNSVAYAVCYLVTETPHTGVVFHVMADDECKVYLNGRTLHRSRPDRAYILDEAGREREWSLPAGTNTLVFKIVNETLSTGLPRCGCWMQHGQTLPDLRVTLEPGAPR
jgi:hypothetical protein